MMVGRFTTRSEVAFGPPHTFGWLRSPEFDANGLEGWERPDGTRALLRRGAQLARLRGVRGEPIIVRPGRQTG
jgi:hypothetical protein